MKNLSSYETNVLVDMLATYTDSYLKSSFEIGKEEEYAKCVLTIKAIQSEIDSRKRSAENTNSTAPSINIE